MNELFSNITKYQILTGSICNDVDIETFKNRINDNPKAYILILDDTMRLLETKRVEGAFMMAAIHTPGAIKTELNK